MNTYIYMVRHGESYKTAGNERTRDLTDKGRTDARKVSEVLKDEGIDMFISSPYRRAISTIEELALSLGKEVIVSEDLKELVFLKEDRIMLDVELYPLVKEMFADPELASPGGESIIICRNRAIAALQHILEKYKGQKVAIGTHGAIMTLMMGYYNSSYDLPFLLNTSKPDVYKLGFNGKEWLGTERMWPV